jgi:hypothetical protein
MKDTAGIMGLFPLILGMRIRSTETIERDLQIFTHGGGEIV